MKQSNLESYNDFELVALAKEQHEKAYEILQKKYEPIIIYMAKRFLKSYPNVGLDLNDYMMEGRIALAKAIDSFDERFDCIFFTHVVNSIKYTMFDIIRHAKKNECLNNAVLYSDQLDYPNEEDFLLDVNTREILQKYLDNLTDIERKIVIMRVKGYLYREIAHKIGIKIKDVDNIMVRIRKKLQKFRKE